jgi:hypothetical protein
MNKEFHAKAQRREGPGVETERIATVFRSHGQRTKDLQSQGSR